MLSVVTIVVHQILHNQGIEYANEFAHVFSQFVASAHVLHLVSDSLEVKYEFGRQFSFILEQVLSSGGRQVVE